MVLRSRLLALVLMTLVLASPAQAAPSPSPGIAVPIAIDAILRGSVMGSLAGVTGPVATEPTIEQLIGQKLIVRMGGRKPTRDLLDRVRRGQIGGVVLLASNIDSPAQLRRLTTRLQREAERGGQPPLLIAVDQEGGDVARVPWAPPTITVPAMGRLGSLRTAREQGRLTGEALADVGINVDLAPVADIPSSDASFMLQQGRTFSSDASETARLADAFARGLADAGVLATMKHFPGIGAATRDTDKLVETIHLDRKELAPDLEPYRLAIEHEVPLIMLSNATYDAWDRDAAAGWSRAIVEDLLRDELGFEGVTMTDSLDGTANARDLRAVDLALRATRAGTDLLLLTGSEDTTEQLYARLVREAQDGDLPLDRLRGSYDRIVALKGDL